MANYNSLKATVNANIKANNNQEITGPVLNSVLTQVVNSLGAGYQFMGEARPAFNPGTPDQRVFYVAYIAGLYANYGNLRIYEGEVAFFRYDTSWSKVVIGAAGAPEIFGILGGNSVTIPVVTGTGVSSVTGCYMAIRIKAGETYKAKFTTTGAVASAGFNVFYAGEGTNHQLRWITPGNEFEFTAAQDIDYVGLYISGGDITTSGDLTFTVWKDGLYSRLDALEEFADSIDVRRMDVTDAKTLTLNWHDGYYLSGDSATFNPNAGYSYARVYIDAPCKLMFYGVGNSAVNMISRSYFTLNNSTLEQARYIDMVRGVSGGERWYEADIVTSGYYYLCSYKGITPAPSAYIIPYRREVENMLSMFPRVITIGDSLSYGAVYTSGSSFVQSNVTIDQAIAKTCGIKSFYVAQAGITTSGWWQKYMQGGFVATVSGNVPGYTDALGVPAIYVLFLGTNGGLTNTLDTDCPGMDISDYSDTNTGCYAKILRTLLANKLTSVVVVPPTVSDETKDALLNLSRKFAVPFIVLPDVSDAYFHRAPRSSYVNSVHYNELGYAYIGNSIVTAINNLPLSNLYNIIPYYNR